ncbi:hypothetical protein C8R44DRAFT_893183 [Mycena epipterygia]|nr:hypothetical protein C8R44DRAFT_893183 [Mycena epipterygia]
MLTIRTVKCCTPGACPELLSNVIDSQSLARSIICGSDDTAPSVQRYLFAVDVFFPDPELYPKVPYSCLISAGYHYEAPKRPMWLAFPSRAKRKPPTASPSVNIPTAGALPDILRTSLLALKESTDAFPPLKSTVGGVIALLEIAERAKHSKSDARAIALRTKEIFDVIAAAVGPAPTIPRPMRKSIERFTALLVEIRGSMEKISLSGGVSRVVHLNRNERALQEIQSKLDDAYRDFVAASALRLEVQQARIAAQQAHLTVQQTQLAMQQTQLATQQSKTHIDVGKVSAATNTLASDLSRVLFYSRFTVFLAGP